MVAVVAVAAVAKLKAMCVRSSVLVVGFPLALRPSTATKHCAVAVYAGTKPQYCALAPHLSTAVMVACTACAFGNVKHGFYEYINYVTIRTTLDA